MANFMPYLIGLVSIILYASLHSFAKKALSDIPPFAFIFLTMIVLGGGAGLCSLFFEKGFAWATALKPRTMLYLGLFGAVNLAAFFLYLLAIKRMPIVRYEMIYILSPLFAAFFAFLMLGEPFKLRYLAALAIMAVGLFIALYDPAKS